jgi:hypothetical protein
MGPTARPESRRWAALALVLLVACGQSAASAPRPSPRPCSTLLADTWTFDGKAWSEVRAPGPFAAAAYDPTRSQVVLFGGTVQSSGGVGSIGDPVGGTWVERNGAWDKRSPVSAPTARYSAVAVFDAEVRAVIVFGGAACPRADAGLWSWDGTTWIELKPNVKPPPRFAATAVYDSARHFEVLFGGSSEQVCF